MIRVRSEGDRGRTRTRWLDSRHTFSFGQYTDPDQMGFRALRVINEDIVAPGEGFGMHFHRDMEIISYVLEGRLEHKDSMGTGSTIRPREVQRMTAGTGVLHSEHNPSESEPAHFLQIWILPERHDIQPSYEQRGFDAGEMRGKLRLVVDPEGREGAVTVHQNVRMYVALLAPGDSLSHALGVNRHAWAQVARGEVDLGGVNLRQGDGAAVSGEETLQVRAKQPSEILLFDLL